MVLPFAESHNMVANLNASHPDAREFRQIIKFLSMSEVYHAITANPTIFESHVRNFWSTAQFNIRHDRRFINANVQGTIIEVTEHTIRHVLKLESQETYEMSDRELVTIILRMGYEGDAYNLKMIKSQVGYNWRYLWHVMIHVFAARKAGWDNLNKELAKGMACLCLGRPFNWARLILDYMKANSQNTLKNKFLLYPRFVEMIVMEKVKGLRYEGKALNLAIMRDRVWKIMKTDHQRSTFSGRFSPLFDEMLRVVGESDVESEEREDDDDESESESDKSPKKKPTEQSKIVESSETESESPVHPKRPPPRIIIKKSAAVTTPKRKPDYVSEPERTKRQRIIRRSPPTVHYDRTSPPAEDKSLKDLIIKLAGDFETFEKKMNEEMRNVSVRLKDNTDELWKLKSEVGRLAGIVEKSSVSKSVDVDVADEDVIIIDEPSEAEKKRDDDERAAGDAELNVDYSFLEEQRIPADTELELGNVDKTSAEAPSGAITVRPPFWKVKEFYGKGKGKEVAEDSLYGFREIVPDLERKIVNRATLLVDEFSVLLDYTLMYRDPRVAIFTSKNVYANPSDWVVNPELEPIWMSIRDDKEDSEIVGSWKHVLIEDIDVAQLLREEEEMKELKRRISMEKEMTKRVEMATKREQMLNRVNIDDEFKIVFERLCRYYKDRSDDVWYKRPEEVVMECFTKDCERVVQVVHDAYKTKPDNLDQIMIDLIADVSTLPLAALKEYLRRYGFISYQINKMSIEAMVKEAKKAQLTLLKKLDRSDAEKLLDEGLFEVPQDYECRARFFSTQFPQLSAHRIVHWRYDGERKCFMVKRVTGATHVLYSTHEVARLSEEDIYELADLKIDNRSNDAEVDQFARFLRRQKRENFDAINFVHPESIRAHTVTYLQTEGMTLREILRDQHLCMKFEHVPKMSVTNLLDNFKRWYLDEKTYEFVFERSDLEPIRLYHPAELNLFTRDDLIKILKTSPVGKRDWNAHILEMILSVIDNLIKRLPESTKPDVPFDKKKKKIVKKKTQEPGRRSGGIHIQD